MTKYFYPRPPRGGRPCASWDTVTCFVFLSTPSARRATRHHASVGVSLHISIHALREEGDSASCSISSSSLYFYPRPPRGGRPPGCPCCSPCGRISIHALREEGDRWIWRFISASSISIHALREEGDPIFSQLASGNQISIHALREEGDRSSTKDRRPKPYFYPRPPRGGRLLCGVVRSHIFTFLSTPSARRATRQPDRSGRRDVISIHALREEGDAQDKLDELLENAFLSTPSARRAT